MIKAFLDKKQNSKRFHAAVCLVLIALAALAFLPFLCSDIHSGHDLKYHFGVIRALSVAWDKGSFFGKAMELIGGDYGYGTGLFYSTIPAGICVSLMKILGVSMISGIYLEIVMLYSLGGILAYFFLRRAFRDDRVAAIGSVVYLLFPYFLWDVYVRFAFSEIFLMATLPMIAWGVYELLYRDNRVAFSALFIVGYTLSILLHFTMTVYVTIFLAVWLAVHFKRVCTKRNLFFFGLATCIVVLLAAAYLVPMLSNYALTQTERMGRGAKTLFKNSLGGFGNFYLLSGFLYVLLVGAVYTAKYLRTPKMQRTKNRLALVASWGLLIFMYSPLFPWGILPEVMGMIQYPFRLMLIGGIVVALQAATLIKDTFFTEKSAETANTDTEDMPRVCEVARVCNRVRLQKIMLWICCALCVINVLAMPFSLCRRVLSTTRSDVPMAQVSGYSEFDGLGVRKNGDYFPKGCTYEYVATRLNMDMVAETDVTIYELADYDGWKQVSFLAESGGYAVLNIPYALTANLALYRFETAYHGGALAVTAECYDGGAKTKLLFPAYDKESKIILSYENAPDFKAYLEERAFGALVLEGDVTATSLKKERAGKYSLGIAAGENGGVLELPSYYYKGYTLTLATADGRRVSVSPEHGRNGFVEAKITESGTLYVEFTGEEFDFAYALTALGGVCAVGLFATAWIFQKKKKTE